MKRSRYQIGVTYLEIVGIFVIFIIAVAILFPLPIGVRKNARRSACASNMKQLGLGFMQYTQDFDSKMPTGVDALNHGWAGQLYPYVKSTGCYQCPDDRHTELNFISYAENQLVAGQSVAKFTNPPSTVVLYEFTTLNCDPSVNESNSATGLIAPQHDVRHGTELCALNFLARDGHVKYLRPAQVSSGFYAVKPQPDLGNGYVMTFAAN